MSCPHPLRPPHPSQDKTHENEVIMAEFQSVVPASLPPFLALKLRGREVVRRSNLAISETDQATWCSLVLSQPRASPLASVRFSPGLFCRKSPPIWKTNRQGVDQNTAPEFEFWKCIVPTGYPRVLERPQKGTPSTDGSDSTKLRSWEWIPDVLHQISNLPWLIGV